MARPGGQGAPALEFRIGLVVARKHGEGNAARAAGAHHLLQAIGPVAAPAEQANDDEAGPADHLLDVQVDRHRMAQLKEVGEAQARCALPPSGLGGGEAGELGIGRREDHDVARRLA